MSEYPAPVPAPENVVADPRRPYKAYAAVVVALLITLVQVVQAQGADGEWSTEDTLVTVLAFLSAVGVYLVENPKVVDTNP
jgi:hypothetical protein